MSSELIEVHANFTKFFLEFHPEIVRYSDSDFNPHFFIKRSDWEFISLKYSIRL